jgi:hypothetical protein
MGLSAFKTTTVQNYSNCNNKKFQQLKHLWCFFSIKPFQIKTNLVQKMKKLTGKPVTSGLVNKLKNGLFYFYEMVEIVSMECFIIGHQET